MASPAAQAASIIHVTTTAQEVNGNAECSLQEAIYAANFDASIAQDPAHPADASAFITTACTAGSGADTIVLLPPGATFAMTADVPDIYNYLGPTATPIVRSTILIEALGAKIVHSGGLVPFRAFAVSSGGSLTIREAHIKGFEVWGGDGAGGGGGGLGAGGGVYVHGGTLNVEHSTFEQNGALGGDGSGGNTVGAGGGGGGLGGEGGRPSSGAFASGGGGGGSRGDGGSAVPTSAAAGGGGTVTAGSEFGDGGVACGADGGDGGLLGGSNGDDVPPVCRGGGGGGGDSESGITVPSGDGGDASYGGGGGGGGYSQGDGGAGGFGGGGGGGPSFSSTDGNSGGSGGGGGFGAGGGGGPGGAIFGGPGAGGTFGGDAGDEHGGGGAGLGGAIFGHEAMITVRNSTFYNNYANRGHSGGGDANDGRGAGGAIFLVAGSLFVNSSTFSNSQTGEFTPGIGGLGGGGIVVYKPTTGEATSLTLRNSILAGNGPHECYARNGASVSGVGNLITDNSANIRGDATCAGVVTSADPQLEALALNAPGRTPTLKIPLTSPAVDAADAATSEPDDQRGVARPQGAGHDIGAFEAGSRPPLTTVTLSPASPDGSNGWYRSTVGVTVAASDADGTVAQTRCALDPASVPASFDDLPDAQCSLASVGSDGQHTIYAASRDNDSNTESPLVTVSFKVDRTAPALSPTLSSPSITLNQTGVTASPNATDATSGVATASCGAIDTSTPGDRTVTCTATDNADNTGSVTVHYVVEYRILGFFSPVPNSKWRVGQTVPVKVALGDAAGTRIPDSEAAALASACRVKFSASGAQTKSPQCMKYASTEDQFVYTWMLARSGTGQATIKVSVSYPGTSLATQLTTQITITR